MKMMETYNFVPMTDEVFLSALGESIKEVCDIGNYPVFAYENDSILHSMEKMSESHHRGIPILSRSSGLSISILSCKDFLTDIKNFQQLYDQNIDLLSSTTMHFKS